MGGLQWLAAIAAGMDKMTAYGRLLCQRLSCFKKPFKPKEAEVAHCLFSLYSMKGMVFLHHVGLATVVFSATSQLEDVRQHCG